MASGDGIDSIELESTFSTKNTQQSSMTKTTSEDDGKCSLYNTFIVFHFTYYHWLEWFDMAPAPQ